MRPRGGIWPGFVKPGRYLLVSVRRARCGELYILVAPAEFIHRGGAVTKLRGRIPFMPLARVMRPDLCLVALHECEAHIVGMLAIGGRGATAVHADGGAANQCQCEWL